jgi:hypothetical protein
LIKRRLGTRGNDDFGMQQGTDFGIETGKGSKEEEK